MACKKCGKYKEVKGKNVDGSDNFLYVLNDLKSEVKSLAESKVDEMNKLIQELDDDVYDEKELQEILDNWGSHEVQ